MSAVLEPVASSAPAGAMALEVQQVSAFYGESQALFDVSLSVPPGTVVALLGRNGVGKTTLLKTIMGLLPARSGRIAYGDRDLTHAPAHARVQAGIGYVPQGRGIFQHLSVQENLQVAAEAVRGRQVGSLEHVFQLFPALYDARRKAGGMLSGGQQQQLAIARALVQKPSLLIFDEPTEGIQPSIVLEIERTIIRLREQHLTILLVEQFLDFALAIADSYSVLARGSVVAQGQAEGLDPKDLLGHLSV